MTPSGASEKREKIRSALVAAYDSGAITYGRLQSALTEADSLVEALTGAAELIEAGLGIGPLAEPTKWNPRARAWLVEFEGTGARV